VFKSLFLLLFLVALLAATVSLRNGGVRLGKINRAVEEESRADIAALRDDVRALRIQAKLAPFKLRVLWNDARRDVRVLEADAAAHARITARRIATLIKAS